jgi:hypothetical protein
MTVGADLLAGSRAQDRPRAAVSSDPFHLSMVYQMPDNEVVRRESPEHSTRTTCSSLLDEWPRQIQRRQLKIRINWFPVLTDTAASAEFRMPLSPRAITPLLIGKVVHADANAAVRDGTPAIVSDSGVKPAGDRVTVLVRRVDTAGSGSPADAADTLLGREGVTSSSGAGSSCGAGRAPGRQQLARVRALVAAYQRGICHPGDPGLPTGSQAWLDGAAFARPKLYLMMAEMGHRQGSVPSKATHGLPSDPAVAVSLLVVNGMPGSGSRRPRPRPVASPSGVLGRRAGGRRVLVLGHLRR